jgi:hypothetical protein
MERSKLGGAGATIAKSGHKTVISRADIERIKANAVIKTDQEIREERRAKDAQQELVQAKASERKKMMMEKEAEAKKRAPKSDIEMEADQARQYYIAEAKKQRNDQADSVKLLNTLRERASAFTVRQEQLKEAEQRGHKEKMYDDRMNMVMEVERLKALKKAEDSQILLKEKAIADRLVLEAQIQTRKKDRLLQEEMREQEGVQMKKSMQIALKEEEEAMKKEIERQKEIQAMVKKENAKSLQRKMELKQRDIEEDQAIMRYDRLKAEEARRREEEAKKEAHEKEMQISKLRAMQEKASNKQAEVDELRAKRASEDREREARGKEAKERERKEKQLNEMKEAHEKQAQYKKYQKAIEMQRQEEEFHKIQVEAEKSRRADQERAAREAEARNGHSVLIRDQISNKEVTSKKLVAAKYEEGAKLRQQTQDEIMKMKLIQEQMIKECEMQGVDPKYLMEMKGLDMKKCVLR